MNKKIETRGRKPGSTKAKKIQALFTPELIKTCKGCDLKFDGSIFIPMKTGKKIDEILSTEGGLMPATNLMISGGPGSGKTTLVLDALSQLTRKGKKCLFISGEMDEVGYFKYCKRMPHIGNVETLFLKKHKKNVKETLEYLFKKGYEVIALDSVAEILGMYKDAYGGTENNAEYWLIDLQDDHKTGNNKSNYYTSFINIQQETKSGDFVGSNRLKHMMDAQASIEKDKEGNRRISFSKNRDCDNMNVLDFSIAKEGIDYNYELVTD
jgi:DNA repair protein RadA/Sms